MKKITCFIIIFFLIIGFSPGISAQGFAWARSLQCDGIPMALATDASGNVYTTGQYSGTGDFDPGPGTYTLDAYAASSIFISKLDAQGNFVWANSFLCSSSGAPFCGTNTGISIDTDPAGNVYVAGYFSGIIDFDPGPGSFTLASTGQVFDIFIVKLTPSGNFVWAKMFDQTGMFNTDGGPFMAVDATGNSYTTGWFSGTVDFDPGPGMFSMTAPGNFGLYLLKLDTQGNFVWANQYSTNWPAAIGKSIDIDTQGNVYTSGGLATSKINSNGSITSTINAGGLVVVDASGNIYLAGILGGTMDADPGPGSYTLTSNGNMDVLVRKFDPAGNLLWAKGIGGIDRDRCLDLSLDNASNLYLTGDFMSTVDFDPGQGTYTVASAGAMDAWILKLDAGGNFGGVATFGGANGEDFGYSIDCSAQGPIYTTGYFFNTVDFDHTAGTFMLSSTGSSADIFIHKMDRLVGLPERWMDGVSQFYPNPTKGAISCQVQNNNSYRYTVTDLMGKVLQTGDLNYYANEIYLNDLAGGLYFVILSRKEQNYTQKIILH